MSKRKFPPWAKIALFIILVETVFWGFLWLLIGIN
jgi:hypothetical protein